MPKRATLNGRLTALLIAGLSDFLTGPAMAGDAAPALLTQQQADCLVVQADAYLSENRPVYVVIVPPEGSCPNPPSKAKSLADKSTASGVGIGLKGGNSSGFIVMTYAQVACVKTHLKEILRQESPAPQKFSLDLENCPK